MNIKQPKYSDIFAAHPNAAEAAEYARVVWAETISELEAAGLMTKSRAAIADRYVRYRTEFHFLYPIAMHEGPTKKSDNGGEYANMLWYAVNKLNEQILKLEASLLLSPQSAGDKLGKRPDEEMPAAARKYLDRSKAH